MQHGMRHDVGVPVRKIASPGTNIGFVAQTNTVNEQVYRQGIFSKRLKTNARPSFHVIKMVYMMAPI